MNPSSFPRTGIGYDVHRLVEGRPLILGGIEIPYERGLEGHSDADVLSHAIADALLGSLAKPDIGHYFPPGDPACAGICSLEILKKAAEVCREEGYQIANVDSTLVLEEPKVLPHAPSMRAKIAATLGIEESAVGVKATTNERMGFPGRGEGIAALATACVVPLS